MNDFKRKNVFELDEFKSYKDIMYIRWFIELHYDILNEVDKKVAEKFI